MLEGHSKYGWIIFRKPVSYLHVPFFQLLWKFDFLFDPDTEFITYIILPWESVGFFFKA